MTASGNTKLHAQWPAHNRDLLNQLFTSYFHPAQPGGAVLLAINGEVVYKNAWGLADLQLQTTITTQTSFNLGSISKTVVAYGILKLASENKLRLDDPLCLYFPEFKNKDIADKVRIYHLLTHSSGLPDSRRIKEEHEFYLTAKDEENWAPLLATDRLEFEPGTQYKYSNPAFNGLALIIEKITGEPWQKYIKRNILHPAGMVHADITNGPHPESGVAHAYVRDEERWKELDYGEEPTFAAAGNGGVWGSVEDMWKYEQAIQQAVFLPEEWICLSRMIYALPEWKQMQPASRLGLSWFINNDKGKVMIGHTGSQGGFVSDYCWWPDQKIFYVLLANMPVVVQNIRQKVFSLPIFEFENK